ncbi:hypothetical protein CQ14_39945 [Bradyrhizobium lablabi]|uniref:Uncharacterized protein n=1 Tax=Bradyrhizobium lablabi TaxID=722472 RepID=A0A0R3MDP9_9BRAD|nr:hypothetical protein CQ14_39945 [Bradyrhizobium lablabi]
MFALEAALQLRDKFGSEITALTTVDAERRAEPGVQILRTNPLVNHGAGNEPDLPSVMTADLRAALGPIVKWSAQEADVEECRNASRSARGSSSGPLRRRHVPRRRGWWKPPKQPMEVLMKAILKGQPNLETDLVAQARRF